MGLNLELAGDYSSVAIGFDPPAAGPAYWNNFTASGYLLRNQVIGGSLPQLTGLTPTQGSGYISFLGGEAIDTGVGDAAAETLIVVARWPSPAAVTANGVIGCFGVSALNSSRVAAGCSITYNQTNSNVVGDVARYNTSDSTQASPDLPVFGSPAGASWAFYALAANDTTTLFWDLTSASSTPITRTGAPRDPAALTIKIGKTNSQNTNVDVAFAAVYQRVLSGTEIQAVYAQQKMALATSSITI